jgi:methylenetetrahydrofolate reductase (NADPH)
MLPSPVARLDEEARLRLGSLLAAARYEVLPLPGATRRARRLSAGTEVAVTADPERSIDDTVDLSVALAGLGYEPIPHLAARQIPDAAALGGHVQRLTGVGITRALVVGGVTDPGAFVDAAALLGALRAMDERLELGIGGYPEGHHQIADDTIARSLRSKARSADWITTQICFDVRRIEGWLREIRAEGIDLPVWLGVPAVTDPIGLVSLGLRTGAGRALQFMFEHPTLVTRLLRPGGRAATRLVAEIAELAGDGSLGIAGLHVFTYNQVDAARRWADRLVREAS